MDPREWAELHVEAAFFIDARGRLVTINWPDAQRPAPLVTFSRTPAGNVWHFRHDVPPAMTAVLNETLATEPDVSTFDGTPPSCVPRVTAALRSLAGGVTVRGGPSYHFPAELPEATAARATLDLLAEHFPDYLRDDFEKMQPCLVTFEGAEAAAICHSARPGVDACEAGVETVPRHRRKGHATRVVAAWAQAVRESGREPLYSTAWDNLASQAVARRLGLVFDADEWAWD